MRLALASVQQHDQEGDGWRSISVMCRQGGARHAFDACVAKVAMSESCRREAAAHSPLGLSNSRSLFLPERMLELSGVDVEEIASALEDQTDYEHRWLIDPRTGQVAFWTSDTGIDGENAVELDGLDLIAIDPLPAYVWFQDMADFAEGVSDLEAGRDLTQALKGRGAFRRFKNQLYEHHPELISSWHALRDAWAQRRAVQWLLDQQLIDARAAEEFATRHPDPDLP